MRLSREWVVITAFLAAVFCFFVAPTFLNSEAKMAFPSYVPAVSPIGVDLNQMLSYSESWVNGSTPYIGWNLYPPFASIIFTPILSLSPHAAYSLITAISFLCVVLCCLVLVWLLRGKRPLGSVAYLMFIPFVLSYGLQFELERGQFNAIAMTAALAAIYLFHYLPRLRKLAYLLFILAVSLKVYPLVFLPLLIDDWRAWRANALRLTGLLAANFAMLFVLGWEVFKDFLGAINNQIVNPGIWVGNHSIRSYLTQLSSGDQLGFSLQGWRWGVENIEIIEKILLAAIVAAILLVAWKAFKRNERGINSELLMICTIAALLIPPVSHDYKLAILGGPIIICLQSWQERQCGRKTSLAIKTLLAVFVFFFASTLFSYALKPELLASNTPALIILTVVTTAMALMPRQTQASEGDYA